MINALLVTKMMIIKLNHLYIRKIHEAGSDHICWVVILVVSVLKKDEN